MSNPDRKSENPQSMITRRTFLKQAAAAVGVGVGYKVADEFGLIQRKQSRALVVTPKATAENERTLAIKNEPKDQVEVLDIGSPADVMDNFQTQLEAATDTENPSRLAPSDLIQTVVSVSQHVMDISPQGQTEQKIAFTDQKRRVSEFFQNYPSLLYSITLESKEKAQSAMMAIILSEGEIDLSFSGDNLWDMFDELKGLKSLAESRVVPHQKQISLKSRDEFRRQSQVWNKSQDNTRVTPTTTGGGLIAGLEQSSAIIDIIGNLPPSFWNEHTSSIELQTQSNFINPYSGNGEPVTFGNGLDPLIKEVSGNGKIPLYVYDKQLGLDPDPAKLNCQFFSDGSFTATYKTGVVEGFIMWQGNQALGVEIPDTIPLVVATEEASYSFSPKVGITRTKVYNIGMDPDTFNSYRDDMKAQGLNPDEIQKKLNQFLETLPPRMYQSAKAAYDHITGQLKKPQVSYDLSSGSASDLNLPPTQQL